MAILVTSQSHFKPLSFDEMLKPYIMATEEYNKREAEIAALDTKAETMRQYAQQEIDAAKLEGRQPASFATQYMDYANSLDKAAEDLATKGLRGTSRKSIYDLTNQYQTNVVPIETALKTRTAKSDEQRKAHLANPDLRFDRDFSTIGLQELIDNPDLGYTPYNLKDFEKRGALSGAGILGRMTEKTTLDPSEQWYNITKGVSQNDLIRWQSEDTDASHYDDPQSIGALNAAREEATKIASTVPENLREEVFNRVFENSVNAIKQTIDRRTNAGYETPSQKRLAKRDRQQFNIWLKDNGYKEDDKGNIIDDTESLPYKIREANLKKAYNAMGYEEKEGKWVKKEPSTLSGSKLHYTPDGKIVDETTKKIYNPDGTEVVDPEEAVKAELQLLGLNVLAKGVYYTYKKDKYNFIPLHKEGRFNSKETRWGSGEISIQKLPSAGLEKLKEISDTYGIPISAIKIELDVDTGFAYGNEYKFSIKEEYLKKLNLQKNAITGKIEAIAPTVPPQPKSSSPTEANDSIKNTPNNPSQIKMRTAGDFGAS